MAIDDREKRASVVGVARSYMRGKFPGTIDQGWRHASGQSYGGTTLSPPVGGRIIICLASKGGLAGDGGLISGGGLV